MTETLERIKAEVWGHLETAQCAYIATAETDQPRVRPVTLFDIDQKLWIATSARSGKARQIRRNPNVEFCIPLSDQCGNGYIRIAGVAMVVSDIETRTSIARQIPFLTDHWSGIDDPDFCLIRTTRVEVEYMRPGSSEAHTFMA